MLRLGRSCTVVQSEISSTRVLVRHAYFYLSVGLGRELQSTRTVRFGTFESDLAAGELRENSSKVRLQGQPFQLLAGLVEKPGEVVTREELKD